MVYLIIDSERKFCKIGYSKHPQKRLKQLQGETLLKLQLAFEIVGNIGTERYIQSKFSCLNASREWYQFRQDIYDYFETCYADAENVEHRNKVKETPKASAKPVIFGRLARLKSKAV